MNHKAALIILSALIFFTMITGCSGGKQSALTPATEFVIPYPVTNSQIDVTQGSTVQAPDNAAGYPAPATDVPFIQTLPKNIEIVAPAANLGNVTGRLLEKDNPTKPYIAPGLFLGKMLWSNKTEAPPLAGFSYKTDPKAIQDQNGNFVLSNIEPGMYVLYIYTPYGAIVIEDPVGGGGSFLYVDVKAGATSDLGELFIR